MSDTRTFQRLEMMIELPNEGAYVGVAFVPGAGYRVGVVMDGASEHMSAAAAWRKAKELDGEIKGPHEPTAFVRALGLTAGRVRAMGLAGREPDGRA